MTLPKRRPTRLKNYDYGSPGAYFITICTQHRRCILSQIHVGEELAPPAVPETILSPVGRIVDEQIRSLPCRFENLTIDKYVIMPNHIHLLLRLSEPEKTAAAAGGASSSPTVIAVVQALKSQTARLCSSFFDMKPLWQRSFHDHVIRGEADYREIGEYIDGNPALWREDCFYTE